MTHINRKGDLILDKDTMCIFLDESGVHNLPEGHDIFCLAGIVIHSTEMPHLAHKWSILMRMIFDNSNHIFHASAKETKALPQSKQQDIFNFFKENNVGIFALGYNKKLEASPILIPYQVLLIPLIKEGLKKILTRYSINKHPLDKILHPNGQLYLSHRYIPFREIVFIFEECDRDKDFIQESWNALEASVNNVPIPVKFCFMPKKTAHACLQMADAIANIAGREIKRYYSNPHKEQGHDFKEIFHSGNKNIKYFNFINKYIIN